MRYGVKLLLLSFTILSLTGLGLTAVSQHHPFTELYPPDVNLDFGSQSAYNLSEVNIGNGITIGKNAIKDSGGNERIKINPQGEGDIQIPNSDLNFSGGTITGVKDLKFEGGTSIGDGLDFSGELNTTDGISLGGNLNMNGNDIKNFFGSACGENQAVKSVYANGTYNCGQAGGGLSTVLSINNTADRNINVDGNQLNNVGKLDASNGKVVIPVGADAGL